MTAIAVRFVAGRYHATPWGHHANEAAVAWPPEPVRLLRALIAVWHLKAERNRWPDDTLARLVDHLAGVQPSYRLPRGAHSHSRAFLPTIEGGVERRTLVFDAFLRVSKDDPLVVSWPDAGLSNDEQDLLDHLVRRMGYLGRAESWCEAEVVDSASCGFANCVPTDAEEDDVGEPVDVLSPMAAPDYAEWRHSFLSGATFHALKGKARRLVEATLPDRLADLFSLDTADFHSAGWSHFPGTKRVTYIRDKTWNSGFSRFRRPARRASAIRFALSGRPLPRIEDTVRIGELMRLALMHKAKAELGESSIPRWLSGRDVNGPAEGHGHAFFLPEDADGDGWIDHVFLTAAEGLHDLGQIIRAFDRVWTQRGEEWRVMLEWQGQLKDGPTTLVSRRGVSKWISVTPYLHPWFRRKGLGYAEQIIRECLERRLPNILDVRPLDALEVNGLERRPLHFHRFRSRGGLRQPDRTGGFFEIEFARPISGPLALGFGCHYGLGLFRPVGD